MRKKIKSVVFTTLFIFIALYTKATDWPISNNAAISLITCGTGNQMHTAFGHSGIRVIDSTYGIDVVFNYGSYNYTPSQFYYHILKGDPVFYIVIEPTTLFLQKYNNENREVVENVLQLDSPQRHDIFNYLMWNADEQNHAYSYNFFTNNCATKLRDVLTNHHVPLVKPHRVTTTYRSMVNQGLKMQPWNNLALYVMLGSKTDQEINAKQILFIPTKLQEAIQPISRKQTTLVSNTYNTTSTIQQYYAFITITAILLLILALLYYSNIYLHYALSFTLLLGTGAIGILLVVQQFLSSNIYTHSNYNLLWALPLNLTALALYAKKELLTKYLKYLGIYLFIVTPVMYFIPQQMHYGFYLWLPLLATYFLLASRKLSNQQ